MNRWTSRLLTVYHQSCKMRCYACWHQPLPKGALCISYRVHHHIVLNSLYRFHLSVTNRRVTWTVLAAFIWGTKAITSAWSYEQGNAQQAPDWSAPCTRGKVASVTFICQEPSCILSGRSLAVVPPGQLVNLVLRITRDQNLRCSKHKRAGTSIPQ